MSNMKFLLVVVSCLCVNPVGCSIHDHFASYEKLYDLGMDAYKQQKWSKCSEFFQSAVDDYHFYKNTVIDCRLKCNENDSAHAFGNFSSVFHELLSKSNCLRRCKKKLGLRAEEEISVSVDKKFEERNPYNYMQFCYFKEDRLEEAASAAYTFYITHQDDKRILENLQYYRTLPGMVEEDFIDLERKPYQKKYIRGLLAYNKGEWTEATAAFEEALVLYYQQEERCRAGCEKGFSHNGFPDFVNAIADHYVTVIVCQQKCLMKLSTFGMEELENFIREHYNYLQYAYYESNNLEKAFESIASYLLFSPDDVEMLANKNYYMKTLRHKEQAFVPSKDAVGYVRLWKQIGGSLDFVRDRYILPRDQVAAEEDREDKDTAVNENTVDTKKLEKVSNRSETMKAFENIGIRLLQESKQLNGTNRFVAGGLIREDQCQALADLARSKELDEFGNRQTTISEITKLVTEDEAYEISLRLLLRAVDVMKTYTCAYFNKPGLVVRNVTVNCRSASSKSDVKLPSGCVLQEGGGCIDTDRVNQDYLSIAYLTDMSDGTGHFYFTDDGGDVQFNIEPLCGLMVAFSSSNKHGVNLPWKHERCAVVISLASNKVLENTEIEEARDTLIDLENERVEHFSSVDNTEILEEFQRQGVHITKGGEELKGKERFMADGLSTQEECNILIQLARREGRSGDGYRGGHASPHTNHEVFTGLNVVRGKQKGVTKGDGYNNDHSDTPALAKFVSPYSKFENFEGLNISKSLKLVEENVVLPSTFQLLLDISEHARLLVEKYLNLTRPLYFDYTHLVCRTAVEGDRDDREADLSHPVHSDNCMIQPDGSCVPDALAYIQRHYSALLYLNDKFEGGQFFFTHRNLSEQLALQPKCGRLVAFNAGDYHGVKAVTKGQRCAIAMWYTHDPNFVEVSRMHARRAVDNIVKLTAEESNMKDKDTDMKDKDTNMKEKDTDMKDKDTNMKDKDTNMKDTDMKDKDTNMKDKDTDMKDKDTNMKEKDTDMKDRDTNMKDKDTNMKDKDTNMKDKDTNMKDKDTNMKDKDTDMKDIDTDMKDKDTNMKDIGTNMNDKDTNLKDKDTNMKDKDTNSDLEIETIDIQPSVDESHDEL